MTCEVEIIAETHTNALYIPLQSVIKIENITTAFVINKHGKREKRIIKTGSDNNRMIHITSGLKEGEKVLLTPPLTNSERPASLELKGKTPENIGQKSESIRQKSAK